MAHETYDDHLSVPGGEAAPRIALKSGAGRIKKPLFGAPSRATPAPDADTSDADTSSGLAAGSEQEIADESVLARWWRESGKIVAGGIVITAAWSLAFSIYITAAIGWRQLFTLLPDQFGSFMTTFMLPLAFLWLVIAYLDRGRELRRESAALRHHLAQLTYPSETAENRIASVSESLKAQARMLVDASDVAVKNMQKLQTGFLRDTEKLASVTGQLEAGAGSAASAVTDQVAKLQTVIDSAADVNLKIEDALRRQHEFIRTASQKTLGEVNSMGQTLAGHVNTLSTVTERARGMSAAIAQQLGEQEKALAKAGETAKTYANDMGKAVAANAEQVEDAAKRAETTIADMADTLMGKAHGLEALFDKQRAELAAAGDRIEDQATKVNMRLGQQTANLDQVMERVLSRVKIVEEALAIQTKELSAASDGAVAKLRLVEGMVKKQAEGVSEAAGRVETRLAVAADEFGLRSRVVTGKFDRATAAILRRPPTSPLAAPRPWAPTLIPSSRKSTPSACGSVNMPSSWPTRRAARPFRPMRFETRFGARTTNWKWPPIHSPPTSNSAKVPWPSRPGRWARPRSKRWPTSARCRTSSARIRPSLCSFRPA
ncbi:MAG: hypothetical protein EXQ84_04920 [Rhodospirillaceae bacterium]|nr:hypothetical protein [Rhodospirillaceae bacterium]